MGRDSNSRSPVCETGIITRLDYPSIFFEELTCPPFSCNARLCISIYFLVSVLFAFSLLSNSIQASRGLGWETMYLGQSPSSISVDPASAGRYIFPWNGALLLL